MKIKEQFIGRDEYGNLQLMVESNSKFFILRHTNTLGFDEITKDKFVIYLNAV